MNNFPYKKILVIRLSSLGDVLLTTPLIRSVKNKYPKTQIDFLVREEYEDVIVYNPYITNIISLKRNELLSDARKAILQNNYDFVIDLQNNLRSRQLTYGLQCSKVRFKKLTLRKLLLVKFKINKLKNLPQIPVRYAETIDNFSLDDKGLELYTKNQYSTKLNGLKNLVGFCPGSKHFTKMWPKDYFIELGKLLIEGGYQLVLFGGKDDKKICSEVESYLPNCINLCNDNNILQTAADMKMCKAVVCNDSGLMHTACALGIPVLAIFGSTVKEFGFFPYGCKSIVLENKSLYCRPCSHIGKARCPKKHFKCMREISPQVVFESLKNLLTSL